MKNCIDEGILQAWFDGELPANEAASIAAHVNKCAVCSDTATAVEAESLALREALAPEFAANVPSGRLRERVDSAIAAQHRARPESPSQRRAVPLCTALRIPPALALGAVGSARPHADTRRRGGRSGSRRGSRTGFPSRS